MCADWSIHDKGDGNPHVHLLVTMRPFKKNHTWESKEIKDWAFVRDKDENIVIDETHPDWWQDKKNPERHGIRIPVLDADGNQKLDSRNRKQWKREVTDATGWNNPRLRELNNELQEQLHILPSIEEILELLEKKDGEIQTLKEEKQMLNDENQQWKELAEKLKAENQMLWVRKMNNIMTCAEEIVVRELVYV